MNESNESVRMSQSDVPQCRPLQLVARLRNYDTCSDADVDEAANVIEKMVGVLQAVRGACITFVAPNHRVLGRPTCEAILDLLKPGDAG